MLAATSKFVAGSLFVRTHPASPSENNSSYQTAYARLAGAAFGDKESWFDEKTWIALAYATFLSFSDYSNMQ